MISMNENRFDTHNLRDNRIADRVSSGDENSGQLGTEVIARVKKLAVEKPLVVVAAGLAIGVLSGFMLKRK